MTALSFHERMEGFVTLGATDFNDGLRRGEQDGTACALDLQVRIADVDRFLADPEHAGTAAGTAAGTVACGALGGTLAIEDGRVRWFVPEGEDRRMRYRLWVRDPEGRALTLTGFKDLADGLGLDVWSDTTTLFVRLRQGHVEDDAEATLLGAGIVRVSHPAFVRQMASMRAHGGPPWRRAAALARFQAAFAGSLARVYAPRAGLGGQPDFPDADRAAGDPFHGQAPGGWHAVEGHPRLRRRILSLRAGDGLALTLHHVRGAAEPSGAPVLCLHGVGVRGDLFLGAPGGASTAQALVDAGHDVWILNWRASIDLPPRAFTLDEAAVFDHPAAIAEVLRQTGAPSLRVLAHCQGSTSFTMTALAGLAPEVTHVVASAVSLHTVVPWRTRVKGRTVLPIAGVGMPYVSAQWGIRAPTVLSRGFSRVANIVRRECDSPVCALANYMYGTGPDVLWVHERLGDRAHEWIAREFGFAPFRFLKQMARCTGKGHLVPVSGLPALPVKLLDAPVPTAQRWTFLAGTRNRLYLPEGQERSHAHWVERGAHDATLHLLDGYGHLDPLLGPGAPRDVYPLIVAGLQNS